MNLAKEYQMKIIPGFLDFNPSKYNVFPDSSFNIINDVHLKLKQYCPICLNIKNNLFKPDSCNHTFCRNCLFKWSTQKKICPLCRKSFLSILKI